MIMKQRRKSINKENTLPVKKSPLNSLAQLNRSQQLKIPSLKPFDIRNIAKSTQLKLKPSKKSKSRKSRCVSVKQPISGQTIHVHDLLKQFQVMKTMIDRQKSPASCKSKSKKKKQSKKCIYSANLKTNPRSQKNLTRKLQKTLKKLNQSGYFKQDSALDNIVPIQSSNGSISFMNQRTQILITENEQDLNMQQVRYFCSQPKIFHKKKVSLFKGDIYDSMARRIQRAWRKYRTRKLVMQYVSEFQRVTKQRKDRQCKQNKGQLESIDFSQSGQEGIDNKYLYQASELTPDQANSRDQFQNMVENEVLVDQREDVMIQTQQFYQQESNAHKITHISNLDEEQQTPQNGFQNQLSSGRYDEAVKSLKIQELAKWNDIITMISSHVANNPNQIEGLLRELAKKSEINKKDLEQKAIKLKEEYLAMSNSGNKVNRKLFNSSIKEQSDRRQKHFSRDKQNSDSSESDQRKSQQFNSKKYIDYLDSDMYPIQSSKQSSYQSRRISKEQQQKMISQLNSNETYPIRLGDPQLYRSQSERALSSSRITEENRNSRSHLIKSNSEKIMKRVIQSISPLQTNFQEEDDQLNIEIIRQQFLQGTDPLENLHSEHMLRLKLAELGNLRQDISDEQPSVKRSGLHDLSHQARQGKQIQKQEFGHNQFENHQYNEIGHFPSKYQDYVSDYFQEIPQQIQKNDSDVPQESKYDSSSQSMHIGLKRETNTPLQKFNMQTIDRNICDSEESLEESKNSQLSDSMENNSGKYQQAEHISGMIFNALLFEVLREMAKKANTLLHKFKEYSLASKPKPKKVQRAVAKKKGFKTNQAQIKSFVQGLTNYLLHEQPHIFKNLQVATGPTAIQMLRYMHQSADDQVNVEEEEDDSAVMVIPNRIFDMYWQTKQKMIYSNEVIKDQQSQDEREKQRIQFLKGLNKVFFRSLFDGFNQCLDFQRNFGQFGKPFPWKRSPTFDHSKDLDEIKKNISIAQKRMTDITTTYCGIIVQKEDMNELCGNEGYLHQVQEDRLSRMLAQDLIEGEQRWIFYDDQETQILVEISGLIAFQMVLESIQELQIIDQKSKQITII